MQTAVNPVFWAKKKEEGGRYLWLPLSQHALDTAQVSGLLWEHWLSDGQRQLLSDSLNQPDEQVAKQVAVFLGASHDLGKICGSFQAKKGFSNSADLDRQLIEQLEFEGFEGLGDTLFRDVGRTPHATVGQVILEKMGVNRGIASIVGGHHGKPVSEPKTLKLQRGYSENYYQVPNPNHPVYKLWEAEQKRLLDWALDFSGFDRVEDLPQISKNGQVIYSGLLIMADWIASNEHYFPLIDFNDPVAIDQDQRIRSGFSHWFKTRPIHFQEIASVDAIYNDRFGDPESDQAFVPRDFQRKFTELLLTVEDPGIFILEAPMGLGKTEAALVGAEVLANRRGQSGIFFGLPTQATSDGIFPRVSHWLSRVSDDYMEDTSLQLVHGKAALNPDYESLASNINIDGESGLGTVTVNQWFKGRKTSNLDDFVVGTVDQFLLNALKKKHLALRHLGFSKKVVIIDEVHACDAYMNVYLNQALSLMGAYGVPVIILSATLPASSRKKMVKSYLQERGDTNEKIQWPEDGLLEDAYPLVTYSDSKRVQQFADFEPQENHPVEIQPFEEDQLFDQLDNWLKGEGVVGIVVNTVKKAQDLAQKCVARYGDDVVDVLHASFIATERKKKERQLLQDIGKGAGRPAKKIIIGTQVIEQSLDIDFDVMVSDLAPMDLLIQRMGRLHRHAIHRPSQHQEARFYVMGLSDSLDFDKGSKSIYGKNLLIRTQAFLPKVLNIPGDISPLVQKVYGSAEPDLADDLKPALEKAETKEVERKEAKKSKASEYLLAVEDFSLDDEEESLVGWLNNGSPDQTEAGGYAQVRDSDETIEVILLKQLAEGYGLLGDERDISEEVADPTIAKRLAQETIKLPGILSKGYNIDEVIRILEAYTAKHFRSWQDSPWLKGQLGVLLDDTNSFSLHGYHLTYSPKFGLSMEKEEKNESL
ncbi:CRISPR-associated helicase Cas3' [Aerococcus sp. UMB8623]|uniref:CRISPR-associated helicase Cas3' n=1 Tax=Aerococcus sp. UMB8623 TaxID=3046348 RepID=UPI00254C11C5|nr:CRISPR-associated helicase Cas3' [Aerococcus sp. UMB8623]MDK6686555.1 CRISPR-associated helicase Cas3' [Aerococcus sp. UMB8623]